MKKQRAEMLRCMGDQLDSFRSHWFCGILCLAAQIVNENFFALAFPLDFSKEPNQLLPMPVARNFLGIEIGGSKLQFLVGDEGISIIDRKRFNVEPAKGAEGIRQMIQDALPELLTRWKPTAIGVGFGGPVDWRTGSICRSHQIEGWSGFDIGPWLQRLASVPVRV